MSLAATISAARRELAMLKTATCEIRTAAGAWSANPTARVACHYEQTPPAVGGPLDYETGNGYGYTVWFADDVAIDEQDTVVVVASPIARDAGMELQVLSIPPRGSAGMVDKIETVKRP